jgi:hypothetical protein
VNLAGLQGDTTRLFSPFACSGSFGRLLLKMSCRAISEMGVSRYVERNSAFGVVVRPSRAAIPPGGMFPRGVLTFPRGRRCCHSFTYLVFLWAFLLPVGTVDPYGYYNIYGTDWQERVGLLPTGLCDPDLFAKHAHARRNYEPRDILHSSCLCVSELIM